MGSVSQVRPGAFPVRALTPGGVTSYSISQLRQHIGRRGIPRPQFHRTETARRCPWPPRVPRRSHALGMLPPRAVRSGRPNARARHRHCETEDHRAFQSGAASPAGLRSTRRKGPAPGKYPVCCAWVPVQASVTLVHRAFRDRAARRSQVGRRSTPHPTGTRVTALPAREGWR